MRMVQFRYKERTFRQAGTTSSGLAEDSVARVAHDDRLGMREDDGDGKAVWRMQ